MVVVVDVLFVPFVGGAALVVIVVVVVVSSPSFILDIMFRSSDSVGTTVVPRIVEISVVVSVETRLSFMSAVVVVISDVDSTVVVSSDRDNASVDVIWKVVVDVVIVVVVSVVVVDSPNEDGIVDALIEDTGDMVESVVDVIEDVVILGMVVVMMISVVCSGWMILEPAVPWAVVVDVVSCKRAIKFGISLTRSVSI